MAVFLTGKHLSRRAVLKGMGATVALPFLDAMIPARERSARPARARPCRLGSCASRRSTAPPAARPYGAAAESVGAGGRRSRVRSHADEPQAARGLSRPPDHRQQHRRAERRSDRRARNRRRSLSIERDVPDADVSKRTEGADVECGISLDQLHAQRFGQDTPLPSMQLCIENVDQSGGCGYGYSCVYTDTISWASPTKPLPMIRDPRVVFDQMFGVLGMARSRGRGANAGTRTSASSTACAIRRSGSSAALGAADRARLTDYLDNVREIERRIQAVEARNGSGEPRELPDGAGRHSRFVRGPRQADVRSADAGVPIRHHARLRVQAWDATARIASIRKAAPPARSTSSRTTARSRNASASWR